MGTRKSPFRNLAGATPPVPEVGSKALLLMVGVRQEEGKKVDIPVVVEGGGGRPEQKG